MIVAVATNNTPKILACETVFNKLKIEISPEEDIEFINQEVDSGVDAMPLSLDDLMYGAKNRAEKLYGILKNENRLPTLSIGLEGGFFLKYFPGRNSPVTFLQSWTYVMNGKSGYWGSSGAVEVPNDISLKILNSGKELGEIIDEITNGRNIRSNQGTVGVLTKNFITRQTFFESALLFALSPFYNSQIYNLENKERINTY